MRVAAACYLAVFSAPCLCFPVKFSGKDCGASAGHYQSFDVSPSTPKTGEVFKVTNHFSFDQDVSGGQFDVKVTALGGIPLKHQTGPLCGIDTSYDVYLAVVKVATVTIYGSTCPMAKGPADISYDIKLSSILPPGLGDASFHLTAKDQKGTDILCVQAHLGIQLEDNADAETNDSFMEALKLPSPPVSVASEPKPWVKQFCKVAWNKVMEHLTINRFCTSAHQMLHVNMTECQAQAEQFWDKLAKECPKEEEHEEVTSSGPAGITLKHSDCGGKGSHAPIVDFGPSAVALGKKTTMVGHGKLDETVTSANFDLTMTGALGTMLHCSGDASQTKSCPLPMGFGSLTMQGMSFPLQPGSVPVNVDMYLKETTPKDLLTTTTVAKATDQNGDEIFCIKIESAPTASANEDIAISEGALASRDGAQPANCLVAGTPCGRRELLAPRLQPCSSCCGGTPYYKAGYHCGRGHSVAHSEDGNSKQEDPTVVV